MTIEGNEGDIDKQYDCDYKVDGDEIAITFRVSADELGDTKWFGKFSHSFEKLEFENGKTFTKGY